MKTQIIHPEQVCSFRMVITSELVKFLEGQVLHWDYVEKTNLITVTCKTWEFFELGRAFQKHVTIASNQFAF